MASLDWHEVDPGERFDHLPCVLQVDLQERAQLVGGRDEVGVEHVVPVRHEVGDDGAPELAAAPGDKDVHRRGPGDTGIAQPAAHFTAPAVRPRSKSRCRPR